MQKIKQSKLLKQIDRYNIHVVTNTGEQVYNAADLFQAALHNLSKRIEVKNIYTTKEK